MWYTFIFHAICSLPRWQNCWQINSHTCKLPPIICWICLKTFLLERYWRETPYFVCPSRSDVRKRATLCRSLQIFFFALVKPICHNLSFFFLDKRQDSRHFWSVSKELLNREQTSEFFTNKKKHDFMIVFCKARVRHFAFYFQIIRDNRICTYVTNNSVCWGVHFSCGHNGTITTIRDAEKLTIIGRQGDHYWTFFCDNFISRWLCDFRLAIPTSDGYF